MKSDELYQVLVETNKLRSNPVDEKLLKEILAIVMMNPLENDRGRVRNKLDI